MKLYSALSPLLIAVLAACTTSVAPPSVGYAKVDMSPVSGASCQEAGAFLRIGADYQGVSDESQDGANIYGVQCRVKDKGDGSFELIARAERRGTAGGSLTLEGVLRAVTGKQQPVSGSFQSATALYLQTDCSVELIDTASVAPGKVRGVLRCNAAKKDNVPNNVLCDARAEFQFENCAKD